MGLLKVNLLVSSVYRLLICNAHSSQQGDPDHQNSNESAGQSTSGCCKHPAQARAVLRPLHVHRCQPRSAASNTETPVAGCCWNRDAATSAIVLALCSVGPAAVLADKIHQVVVGACKLMTLG